ncbi:MAG: hemolysin family protein [Gammaproteobacteria bacterium]|nr:hemolysin family protein [Gammaproteobacteria bacterium]MBU2178994.1 hemolysin family protein [Gammaproteobacteria bacterium]MBU2224424.1 hemolysin family protein [Gammaproteobacteria bacterium]MBU2279121.1 hemolysin family protein [Gammaproteobacteria bacterium]MBU2425619.1 hemolysin family protein [Gammaproteobacteria bacterium]
MEILILVSLILLNGIFAMSEIAIVTARKSRLTALAHNGNSSAAIALKLAEDPTQFLSTVQIGITSIGILNGIFGEAILAGPFALWLQELGMPADFSSIFATVLVVVVVTYVSIVVGELVPKRIGQISSETIACLMAKPMQMLSILTKPFVWLLSGSTQALMRLFGFADQQSSNVTHEDIHALLLEGSSSGVIEHNEHTMVKNVFRLDERSISSLMVPRSDIVFLDVEHSIEDNLKLLTQSPHSRFPVCRGNADELIGVVSTKQLLVQSVTGNLTDLTALAQPCNFVPDSLTGMELLDHFRTSGSQMVFVVDEYGDLKGLVTLLDLMEALTGEFTPDGGEDMMVITREDGSMLLDGLLPVIDLKDALNLNKLPEEESNRYQTLNGLIMFLLGKMPQTADKVQVGAWMLEIIDMDGKRIDKVLAIRVPEPIDPRQHDSDSEKSG